MRTVAGVIMLYILIALGSEVRNAIPAQVSPASIGMAIGQQAPAFEAMDQFGRTQTKEALKGPNGTVLLFFRSADW
jgi:hypothetical protein